MRAELRKDPVDLDIRNVPYRDAGIAKARAAALMIAATGHGHDDGSKGNGEAPTAAECR